MERVWLRGVPGRGEEVMDLLAKFGGKPTDIASGCSDDPKYILFMDHDDEICAMSENLELAKVIMDCYNPISLPAEDHFWDDGTLLIRRNILQTFGIDYAIFEASDSTLPFFMVYAGLTTDDKVFNGGLCDFGDFRPATESETVEFVNRLLAIGKFWNPWTKKMEDLKQVK